MTLLCHPLHFDLIYLNQILHVEKNNEIKIKIKINKDSTKDLMSRFNVGDESDIKNDDNEDNKDSIKNAFYTDSKRDSGPIDSIGYIMNGGSLCDIKTKTVNNNENNEIQDNCSDKNIENIDSGFGSSSSSRFQDNRHFIALTRAGKAPLNLMKMD